MTVAVDPAGARLLVQPGRTAFPDMAAYIAERFSFELLQLSDYEIHRAHSKWAHLRGLMRQSLDLVRALGRLRQCRVVIAIGPISYLVKLLRRLHLVRYETSFCLGWHVRSPRWFPLFRALGRLDGGGDRYIVFSEWEIGLYQARLGIDPARMDFLPYGDWAPPGAPAAPDPREPAAPESGSYYFAGGYSNRDYPALIAAFRTLPQRLVIVCSAHNTELDDIDVPPNVTILRDLPGEAFDLYVRGAKACVVPLKHDTGASGQSVMLRLMRNRKAIVASDFGGVRGYVVDGESGLLVKDFGRDLPAIVARLEREPDTAAALGEAAYERYRRHFSVEAGRAALDRILAPAMTP
ncbi:MAG: glycosyltransferase family 4 protein [Alphaproteobacteria bacterium]|nr:glycosyltransferase family 4 protein [Alphaproteobacteria bacterium]